MRLLSSQTSPYARKTLMAAIEAGVHERLEIVPANPLGDDGATAAINPLGKIPALILADGVALYDSAVICEYFDSLGGAGLFPGDLTARFDALTRHALAQGVMDAAFAMVMEMRRPEGERSQGWMDRWSAAIRRSLQVMGRRELARPTPVDIGWIAQAAAIGYVGFRLPHLLAAASDDPISTWWEAAQRRPSVAATAPV